MGGLLGGLGGGGGGSVGVSKDRAPDKRSETAGQSDVTQNSGKSGPGVSTVLDHCQGEKVKSGIPDISPP